ncbi:MAG: hypothetical protein P8J87_11310, partial [Verrucomicrobiales bacterium]|nr:hypothetical protein [Verrucomicrobiales bacterium]
MNLKHLALLVALATTAAQAASPDWSNVLPRGTQRGTETTFTLYGNRLADAEEIIAYSPEFFEVRELAPVGEDGKKATAKIFVKPGCPLGEHQFRLRTKSGISYLRTLWVSQYENAAETEPNNEFT